MVNPKLHDEMDAALRNTWFKKLGISTFPANGFANQDDYNFMMAILEPATAKSSTAKKKHVEKKHTGIKGRLRKIKRTLLK